MIANLILAGAALVAMIAAYSIGFKHGREIGLNQRIANVMPKSVKTRQDRRAVARHVAKRIALEAVKQTAPLILLAIALSSCDDFAGPPAKCRPTYHDTLEVYLDSFARLDSVHVHLGGCP